MSYQTYRIHFGEVSGHRCLRTFCFLRELRGLSYGREGGVLFCDKVISERES